MASALDPNTIDSCRHPGAALLSNPPMVACMDCGADVTNLPTEQVIPWSKITPVPQRGTLYPRTFAEQAQQLPSVRQGFNQAEFYARQKEAARRYAEQFGKEKGRT